MEGFDKTNKLHKPRELREVGKVHKAQKVPGLASFSSDPPQKQIDEKNFFQEWKK